MAPRLAAATSFAWAESLPGLARLGAPRTARSGQTPASIYGHKKQGAAFGHTKIQGKSLLVRGLNALAATISTPLAAPVIAATRLRGGNANSACGAASLATEAVATARATGCTETVVVRAGSAFYSAAFTGAVRRAGAFSSVTVQMNPHAQAAIAAILETAWTPINYSRFWFLGHCGRGRCRASSGRACRRRGGWPGCR